MNMKETIALVAMMIGVVQASETYSKGAMRALKSQV